MTAVDAQKEEFHRIAQDELAFRIQVLTTQARLETRVSDALARFAANDNDLFRRVGSLEAHGCANATRHDRVDEELSARVTRVERETMLGHALSGILGVIVGWAGKVGVGWLTRVMDRQ